MLNEFIQTIKERGVAKPSHFIVDFNLPPFLTGDGTVSYYTYKTIKLFCEGAAFPEMALATSTIKDYGVNREVVYDKMYGTLPLTFVCDQGMYIKQFFDTWIQSIAPSRGGLFEYPERYTADWMTLYQLDAAKNKLYYTKFHQLYPKVVNDIQLSSGAREYSKFQVLFTYERWSSGIENVVQTTESMRAAKSLFNTYRDNIILPTREVSSKPYDLTFGLINDATELINGGLPSIPGGGIIDQINGVVGAVGAVTGTINGVISTVNSNVAQVANAFGQITDIGNQIQNTTSQLTNTVNQVTSIVGTTPTVSVVTQPTQTGTPIVENDGV